MSSFLDAFAAKPTRLNEVPAQQIQGITPQDLEMPYPGVESQIDDSWYSGVGSALVGGVQSAYYETKSTAQTILATGAGKLDEEWEKTLDTWAAENRKTATQRYAPDPELSTTAAQIVYGASKELTKIAGAALSVAPLAMASAPGAAIAGAAALGYGLNAGIQTANELKDQGVDRKVANKAGTVAGVAGAVGVAMPGGFGLKTVANAAAGAGVNMGLGVTERGLIHHILENADYSQAAEQYDPFDPLALSMEGIIGGVVGGFTGKRSNIVISKETEDAARVREQIIANKGNLPVDLNNQSELAAAYEGQRVVAEQVNSGQPASVPQNAYDVQKIDEIKRASAKRLQDSMLSDGVVLQNRDRSSAASITQMRSIAANPDYMRLGMSRDFTVGAPVVAHAADIPEVQRGLNDWVVDADGNRYPVQYAVVEADDVLTSNNIDGSINPTYGLGAQTEAIAGNGRAAGIKRAYEQGTADKYRAELEADSVYGISSDLIQSMRSPMLVRIMRDEDIRANMGDITNRTATAQLSASEQALTDSKRIDLSRLSFTEDGGVSPDSVREFVSLLPQEERAGLIDKNGFVTQDAVSRLDRALFQAAYNNTGLTDLLATNSATGISRMLSAFRQLAPKLLQLEGTGELDFRSTMTEVLSEIVRARSGGKKLSLKDIASQRDAFRSPEADLMLKWLGEVSGSAGGTRAIVDTLGDLASFVRKNYDNAAMGGDMFGDAPQLTRLDVVREFSRKTGIDIDESQFVSVRDLKDAVRKERVLNSDKDVQAELRKMADPPIEPTPKMQLITVAKGENGIEHRVWGVDGNPDLIQLPSGIDGIKPFPVRLQEGTRAGDHLRKHEEQLLKGAGYSSAEEAIWDVAKNYRWITRGTKKNALRVLRPLVIEENGTIRRAVLQVELQEDIGIYRVGSILFSTKPLKKTEVLFDRQAPDRGPLSPARPTSELASTRALTRKQNIIDESSLSQQSIGQKVANVNDVKRQIEGSRQVAESALNKEFIAEAQKAEDSQIQREAMTALEDNPNMQIQMDEGETSISAAEFVAKEDQRAADLDLIADDGLPVAVVCAVLNGGLDGK